MYICIYVCVYIYNSYNEAVALVLRDRVARAGTQFTCFTGTKVQTLTQKALQAFANLLSKRANSSTKCSGPPPRRSQIQKTSSLGHIYRST